MSLILSTNTNPVTIHAPNSGYHHNTIYSSSDATDLRQSEKLENATSLAIGIVDVTGGDVQKGFDLVDGQLVKSAGAGRVYKADYRTQALPNGLSDMVELLANPQPNRAILLGTSGIAGDTRKVVTKKKYSGADSEIVRGKDFIFYDPETNVIGFDIDTEVDRDTALSQVFTIAPELRGCAYIVTASASSHIYNSETGECLRGDRGHHIYFQAMGGADDIARYVEILKRRCWLLGDTYSRYILGEPNVNTGVRAAYDRYTFDAAVFSPERFWFEAGADCGVGLVQRRPKPLFVDGGTINLTAIPDLSQTDVMEADRRKAKAKAKAKALIEDTLTEQICNDKQLTEPAARKMAREAIEKAERGILSADHILYYPGGQKTIRVSELTEQHNGLQICDPQEPSYHGWAQKAVVYVKDGRITIPSKAHGDKVYTLEGQGRGFGRIRQEIATQVRRKPDLAIGDREFSEVADLLPKSGLVVLHGFKGAGKSEAIAKLLGNRLWISSTPLISLGRDQAETWNGVFINDGDRHGGQFLKDGRPVNGAAVCIPSLPKVAAVTPEVFIVDEVSAHLEFLLNSPLANKNGSRPILLSEHSRLAKGAELVILADADLTEETIEYYEALTGHRAFLVSSECRNLRYKAHILDCTRNEAIAALKMRFEQLPAGKIIYINTDGKGTAKNIARMLDGLGIKSLLITSETSGGQDEASFLASKGRDLPGLIAMGIQVIISSPTIAQGFSIKNHTDLIDSVWGFYTGGSITAHGIAQSLDRVRSNDVERYISISNKGSAYSKLSQAETIALFMDELQQLSTKSARLVRCSLSPDVIATTDTIDWQSQNLKMLAALEVRRNRGMAALRDTVIALLEHEGKTVVYTVPDISHDQRIEAKNLMKSASSAIKVERAQTIAAAANLTEEQAEDLSEKTEALTPDEINSLAKYHLSRFYRLEVQEVDAYWVMTDNDGRTRQQIRKLEQVLDESIALEVTAKSISENPGSPQDWSKAAAQNNLLIQSGAADLIRSICRGEVDVITSEIAAPIAAHVRANANEFRLASGIKSARSISDQQIVGQFLEQCGIKTTRNSRQGTYTVKRDDSGGLNLLLGLINKRKNTVTPPLDLDSLPGGCHAQNRDDDTDTFEYEYTFEWDEVDSSDTVIEFNTQNQAPCDGWFWDDWNGWVQELAA